MQHDKGIVKELVEILSEAKQVVPEWLENCKAQVTFGSGGRGRGRGGRGRGSSRFGATDFRRDGQGHQGRFDNSRGGGWGGHATTNSSSKSWF
jgi:ATP-dependent RNA helicase DDX3X